jgi:Protein of unknown function (DUF2794)
LANSPASRSSGSRQLSLVHTSEKTHCGSSAKIPSIVSFDRSELVLLLNVYGRKVASGEWRDYAMDMLKDRALFSVYRRTSERPLYMVEKNPRLRNRQGQYALCGGADGRILKRGHDLARLLKLLDPPLALVR